jgi:predicted RNase H-like nuclease (RuvC/YqgF family)
MNKKTKTKILTCLILCFASVVLADDFKTIDGKEYKNATVTRVEPDGIVLMTKGGISKVYFTELPKEVRERFHYDPEKAAAYSAEHNAAQEQLRKQQGEAQSKQEKIHQLEARYSELDQKEEDLMQKIGQAQVGEYQAKPNEALHAQLPTLYRELDDVRHEKDQVRRQLEQAQR